MGGVVGQSPAVEAQGPNHWTAREFTKTESLIGVGGLVTTSGDISA